MTDDELDSEAETNIYVRVLLELLFWGLIVALVVGIYYAVH